MPPGGASAMSRYVPRPRPSLVFALLLLAGASAGASQRERPTPPGPEGREIQRSGLRSEAEIASATFVALDFKGFPTLPAWKVPATDAIFVSTDGDDHGTGEEISPFRTLARAVRAASAGDTIVAEGGTYREVWEPDDHRALLLETDNLTLMAAPGETVRLQPAAGVGYGIVINARHVVVRGFHLDGFAKVGILFEPGRVRNRDIVLANLEITGSEEAIAMWEAAGSVDELLLVDVETDAIVHCGHGPCSSWRLERVVIDASGGEGWGADAFAVESGDNILIVDTEVRGATSDGIDTKATRVVVLNSRVRGVQNNAIKLWHGGDVINTVIWRGWASPVWVERGRFRFLHSVVGFGRALARHRDYSLVCGYDERRPMKIEIVNSIIANPSGGVWINPETSKLAIRNTLFYTTDGSEILIHGEFEAELQGGGVRSVNRRYGSGNLAADPMLDRKLRPARSSPAVDAGVRLTHDYPIFDHKGKPRLVGEAPDIGAYELQEAQESLDP